MVKVNISTTYLEKPRNLQILEEIISHFYKKLLLENSVFRQPTKKVRFYKISSETVFMQSIGREKILHIHNLPEENPAIYFFIFKLLFLCAIFQKNIFFCMVFNYFYYY